MRGDRPQGTKLLVATIGLATVSYVGCGNSHPPGNLMTSPLEPTATSSAPEEMPPGNLMAPPAEPTVAPTASAEPTTTPVATTTASASASASAKPTALVPLKPPKDHPHGNLMAPPPPPPKK